MKNIIIIALLMLSLTTWAQDYKMRKSAYLTGGTISLGATALCFYGAWLKEMPTDEPKRTASLQTRDELRMITYITGASTIACYTMAYVSRRKLKKTNIGFAPTPNGIYLCYRF